jgi:hypothetical protein
MKDRPWEGGDRDLSSEDLYEIEMTLQEEKVSMQTVQFR